MRFRQIRRSERRALLVHRATAGRNVPYCSLTSNARLALSSSPLASVRLPKVIRSLLIVAHAHHHKRKIRNRRGILPQRHFQSPGRLMQLHTPRRTASAPRGTSSARPAPFPFRSCSSPNCRKSLSLRFSTGGYTYAGGNSLGTSDFGVKSYFPSVCVKITLPLFLRQCDRVLLIGR